MRLGIWFRLAAALVLAAALASAALWSQRREILHGWLLRELARQGAAPARVEIVRFDAHGLALRDLRAGTGDALAIDAIDADYTLQDLWRGRVGELRISGIRLTGAIDAAGSHFGGLEALAAGSDDAGRTAAPGLRLPVLPTNRLSIEGARAEIATEQGPLRIEFSADAQDRDAGMHARADLVADHALAHAAGVLEIAGEGDRVRGAAGLGLDLAPGAGLRLPLSAGSFALTAQIEIAGSEIRVALAPGPFALTFAEGADALRLEGKTPQARLATRLGAGDGLAPWQLETRGGELRAPTLALAARGFDFDLTFDPSSRALAGSVAVAEIDDTSEPRRAPAFALAGRLEPDASRLRFDLSASETQKRVALRAQGSFDPETRSGEAQWRMEPVRFAADALQPAQLAPQLEGLLSAVAGTLEAAGSARYEAGRAGLMLDVAARDFGFTTPLAQFAGVNGTLHFEGPSPFSTPPGQLVSIARIGFGLDLTNGLVAGGLRPDGSVVIEKAEWQILGGRVRTAGRVDPSAPRQALVLEAEALDLAQLLALVDLEGLSGEGVLDGTLPIERSADAIEIDHAVLRARPGGRLRYHPAPGAASLRQSGAGFELLLGAFENLAVEKLELELDGDANGTLAIALRLVGANPEFQNGRPLHYNLNVESRLADILRKSAAVYEIPQVIEQRLERFGRPAR